MMTESSIITRESYESGRIARSFVIFDSRDGIPYYVANDWDNLVKAVNTCRDDDGCEPFEDMRLRCDKSNTMKMYPENTDGTGGYYEIYVMACERVE